MNEEAPATAAAAAALTASAPFLPMRPGSADVERVGAKKFGSSVSAAGVVTCHNRVVGLVLLNHANASGRYDSSCMFGGNDWLRMIWAW